MIVLGDFDEPNVPELAAFSIPTPAQVRSDKEELHALILDMDDLVRSSSVPRGVLEGYKGFRARWQAFYNTQTTILTSVADRLELHRFKDQAASWQNTLSKYGTLSMELLKPGGGGATTEPEGTVDKITGTVKTVAIVGAVVVGGLLLVMAANVYGATKGGTELAGKLLTKENPRRRRRRKR